MEALEAVIVLILTVLLMFIVMSPATWSSSKAAACDGEPYEHPSSCISTRLDFVFSPSPACSPYSLFDDDSASCHNTDNISSNDTAIASDSPIPSTDLEPAAPVHDLASPALCAP